jgi:hypothetical protein
MVTNGGFRRYSKMLVLKNSVSSTIFLSALYPYTTGTPVVTTSGQSVSMASLRVTSPGYRDLVFNTQAGTLAVIPSDSTGMSKPVKGNGRINFYSEDTVGQFSAAFLHYGDSLVAGNQVVIRTGKKMDVAWTQPDGDVLAGYVSDSGLVRFRSDTALQMLTGPAVSSVSYNPATHLTAVSFVGKGNFLMGGAGLTWVWSGQEGTDWHNPTNWHLMNHPAVKGVPVASNNVVIPSDAVNMPLITSSNPAVCHNLEVQSGASLTIQSMKFLTVEGTLTIGGDSY